MHGEHLSSELISAGVQGSSPLARGTSLRSTQGRAPSRLIPARAGNIGRANPSPKHGPVHPRSRGEHSSGTIDGNSITGPSPLARGTHASCLCDWCGHRLIPARAGNTRGRPFPSSAARAHPRSRGEHLSVTGKGEDAPGSSPLARGTHAESIGVYLRFRLIPARAGNTLKPPVICAVQAAHPRSRGEHSAPGLISQVRRGSSPHAQGTLFVEAGVFGSVRRIPAHAGNTRRRKRPP